MIGGAVLGRLLGGRVAKVAKWALPALALAGAAGYVWWLRATVDDLRADREQLQSDVARLRANSAALRTELDDKERQIEALAQAKQRAEERAAHYREIRSEVANAPDSDDGPVAPVLRRTLRSLHERARGQGGADAD